MTKIDTTLKALQGGLTELAPDKAIKNIEGWQDTLEAEDFRGAQAISTNLGKLKKLLQADSLDGEAIMALLGTLGEETVRAGSHVDGAEGERIKQLGELLSSAGASLGGAGHSSGGGKGKSTGSSA